MYRDGDMSSSSQISELFSTMDVIYVPAGGTENMSQSNWSESKKSARTRRTE